MAIQSTICRLEALGTQREASTSWRDGVPRHGPVAEDAVRPALPEGHDQLLVRGQRSDGGAFLEGEVGVLDGIDRADGDAVTAGPAPVRADDLSRPFSQLEDVGTPAYRDARSAAGASPGIDSDLRHGWGLFHSDYQSRVIAVQDACFFKRTHWNA